MDSNEEIDNSLKKIQSILQFTKGEKLIMATYSNSRSTTRNDKITNRRGKKLEESEASNHLHVINENNKGQHFRVEEGKAT